MASFDSAYNPAAITGYLSSIESLSGTNFRKWKEQISIILGVMDLDYALRVDAPAALTAESSTEQKAAYEKWERSNCISLMIMKGSITTAIRGAIPDSDNAKLYLAHIEEQFQGSSKAHATTLITKMVTLKYSGSNGVREHILRMNDMASQLKGLDMEISEERLKSEQPDSAHVAITGPSKGKGKKFGKGNVQGNKSASVTKTDKASSSGTKGSSGPSGSCTPRIINLEEIQDHVSIPVIQKVGAPLPHRENNDAPEVVPNDVPPIMDPAPIPANEQPLRRSGRERRTAISDDYIVYLDEADYNLGIGNDPTSFKEAIMSDHSTQWLKAMKDELESMKINEFMSIKLLTVIFGKSSEIVTGERPLNWIGPIKSNSKISTAAAACPPPPKKKRQSRGAKREPPENGYFRPPDLDLLFAMPQRP
ncbi:hypothetical protein RJ639_014178 [Escallonia herrerae]|uniref:Gag protein n=1 Tax=Escallonia herrerae TaxID=1293975 RepID=A0AA89AQX6_9ASTE|nr:hypothetical protein RJ639_014178 [Escallonia herrerae]